MLKIRVRNLWVRNLQNYYFSFLTIFVSFFVVIQCQIVRKSIELPVKDYLSSPRTGRHNWNGRDPLYLQRDNSDSVRNFDHLPPHTPASALVFSGLVNDFLNPTNPTPLFLTPTIVYNGRRGENSFTPVKSVTKPHRGLINQNNVPFNINLLLPTSSSPTKALESEQQENKKRYTATYSAKLSNTRNSYSTGRKRPLLSTPSPALNDNNDAVFGYFNKLPASTTTSRDDKVDQMVESINHLAQYSNLVPRSKFVSRSYKEDIQTPLTPPRNFNNKLSSFTKHNVLKKYQTESKAPSSSSPLREDSSPYYSKEEVGSRENYSQSGELNYYENSSGKGETDYSQEQQKPNYYSGQSSEYRGQSNESNDYDSPTERPLYNQDQRGSAEYYSQFNDYYDYESQPYSQENLGNNTVKELYKIAVKQPYNQQTDEKHKPPQDLYNGNLPLASQDTRNRSKLVRHKLPSITPTIGVIGWKSNRDQEADWKPNETLSNIPNQYIRGNSKENSYNNTITTTVGPFHKVRDDEKPIQNQEEPEEEEGGEEEEDEESEEEEEGEDDEEEDEEEESYGEEYENEEKEPLNHSSKYENSSENYENSQYSPQYQDERNKSYSIGGYFEEEEPLPPGPPYLPPSNLKGDPRTNGYLPFPSLGVKPRNRVGNSFQEPWKPLVPLPKVASQTFDNYKANEKYMSEIDRWLYEGKSVFDFPKEKDFQGQTRLNEAKSKLNLDEIVSSGEYFKSKQKRTDLSSKDRGNLPQKTMESDRQGLAVEHRYNPSGDDYTSNERKTPRTSAHTKQSDTNHLPHLPSQRLEEKDHRNGVREPEFPREVPTRVKYPGKGLWAKPKAGTGVDLGFVPKKVYTQTRKYNTVRHLPQEAALVDASTQEEKINAPRLREVISHKKIQQVYEEEGYEDSGYDHGGHKKHGQHEAHILSQGSNQYSNPEIVWGTKSKPVTVARFSQRNRTPTPFTKKPEEPSSGLKSINSRHKYSSKLQPSLAALESFEAEDVALDVSDYIVDSPSKERKSRDLSSLSQDEVSTHFTSPLREIEDPISSLSGSATARQPHREYSRTLNSERKYKEIVRSTSHSEEEYEGNKKDRALRVNVKDDELNIRHPFLPKDGNGEIHIDYVKERKLVEPDFDSPRRKYKYEDDHKVPEVTEPTITTTNPKVTIAKSTTTTTEYTPEDSSTVLKRLKSNVFLSSVFPTLESFEDKLDQYENLSTTTTPKITTYRGKTATATEETSSYETPKETLERLKSNPFLSSILTQGTDASEETTIPSQRGVRVKHVVVNPRGSNTMTDSSVKHVEQLTLAQYSGPSHGLMYTQVPPRTQKRIHNLAKHLNGERAELTHVVVRRSVSSKSDKQDDSKKPTKQIARGTHVDEKKYPFYYSPASVSFPNLSPLRYALNPTNVPNKTSNGMEFYQSRDKTVRCYEPIPPKDIVPSRQNDGEWNKKPRHDKKRLGKLGDQIDCLKVKYFGEDPLDNPLFKEENVSIPSFKSPSPKDSLVFYYDVVKNIKSTKEESNDELPNVSSEKREIKSIFRRGLDNNPVLPNSRKKYSNKITSKIKLAKYIYSSTYRNSSEVNNDTGGESKLSTNLSSVENQKDLSLLSTDNTQSKQNIIKSKELSNDPQESPMFSKAHEIQMGFQPIIPVVLKPPKDVTVSFNSKGTSNHPKIKTTKDNPTPYNINIKVVPKGTVGYLQSHNPFHVHDFATSMLGSALKESVKPVFVPDSASSAARAITEVNKQPTTVTYLTINPEGDLLHKHIRTFVPVPSRPTSAIRLLKKYNTEANEQGSLWNPYTTGYDWSKPTYRVKRSNENDKYINSKESLELKNYLLQKYKDILSQQTTEASTEKSSSERLSTRTSTSTTRTFPRRHQRPPYNSRYTTISSVSFTEKGEEKRESKAQTQTSQRTPPIRRPKLRFPKLTMNIMSSTSENQAKVASIQDPTPARALTTTTTSTTSPPSTTTRMYKPRMSYRKEYSRRPIEKVTDMFAVLKRQPSSSTEPLEPETATESVPYTDHATKNRHRKTSTDVFQRSGERRVPQGRTIRRRVFSHVSNTESALNASDHPDLRTPISRSSRHTPEDSYSDMLVYMVNPSTGLGQWKVVLVPAMVISRMDNRRNSNINRLNNRRSELTTNRRHTLRPEPTYENYESKYIPREDIAQETITKDTNKENLDTAVVQTKSWNKIKPKPSRSFEKEASTGRDRTVSMELEANPQNMAPDQTNPHNTASTLVNPQIIMEPYRRKYIYVKV